MDGRPQPVIPDNVAVGGLMGRVVTYNRTPGQTGQGPQHPTSVAALIAEIELRQIMAANGVDFVGGQDHRGASVVFFTDDEVGEWDVEVGLPPRVMEDAEAAGAPSTTADPMGIQYLRVPRDR